MEKRQSNSVGRKPGLWPWLCENLSFFKMRIEGLRSKREEMQRIVCEVEAYGSSYTLISGLSFNSARILEIGFGARPNRLIALVSLGLNAWGIDLDRPILNGTIREFKEVFEKNGAKRLIKSFVRNKFFDVHERSKLNDVLRSRGRSLKINTNRFIIGDASEQPFEENSYDFIYSEDVFEHIPPKDLERLCVNLSRALAPTGVALISPAVFTGIAGGHLVEWYPNTLEDRGKIRASEPWDHLRTKRFSADCYLNELRVEDFSKIFRKYFEVVEIINQQPGLGSEYLTTAIKQSLSDYSTEELLSHKWTFVLRKHRSGESIALQPQ